MSNTSLIRLQVKSHALPLLILFLAAAIGQIATLIQQPLAVTYPDTASYTQMAHAILASPQGLLNTFRLPGYPLFLAALFQVSGGEHLDRVVVAQVGISLLAVLECYLLTFRLAHRRWIACLIASAVGMNLCIISWERTVLSESLSWWSLITLFLCYERFIRRPSRAWGGVVALAGFIAIIIRPFNLFIPGLLLLLALLKAWRSHELRRHWKSVSMAVALLCVGLASYAGLNAGFNGFFGLTDEANIEALAKVLEYHMQDFPVPPDYAAVQADAHAYAQAGNLDPWYFAQVQYATKHYDANQWRYPGGYAEYIILHHPGTFLLDSLPDITHTWLGPTTFYAPYNRWPAWINGLFILSSIELALYVLLPMLLLVLCWWVWRQPQDTERFLLCALGMMVGGAICLAALGNYAEFYRIRSPVDWAMILLGGVVLAEGAVWVARRARRPGLMRFSQHADLRDASTSLFLAEADPWAARPSGRHQQETRKSPFQNLAADSGVVEDDQLPPEISIVLPCLNEEQTIGGCIDRIKEILTAEHLSAEVLVVDNASTDRSAEVAHAHGARVVSQPARGYGNAYLKGFAEARGKYIVMADADDTYDFHEIAAFVELLRQGYDLVMGNRFSGRMAKGAMPWSHRYIGNPLLSGLLNLFFHTGVRDAHCGMRAVTMEAYRAMRLQTGGMEFASEMVINAAKAGLKMTERPIAYYPRTGETKLRTVRDGWRHLRFLLLYSPTHLFLIPGGTLLLLGLLVLSVLVWGPFPLFGHRWDVHTMLLASGITLIGLQIISLGLFARFFSLTEELDGECDRVLQWLTKRFRLERGLLIGVVILGFGVVMDSIILVKWIAEAFGPLHEVRPAIFATTLIAMGTQIMFGSFFLSFLQFRKQLSQPQGPQ